MSRLLLAVLTLFLLAAAPAHAAFSLANPSAKPDSVKAGAHADFKTHVETSGGDIKSLVLHLPPGLIGNPQATPLCPLKTFRAGGGCPDNTQIGQASNKLTLDDLLGAEATAGGPIFNVQPEGSEPARLGIRVDSPVPGGAPTLLESVASTRPTDQGLDSTLDNIPNQASGMNITITSLDVTLFGKAGKNRDGKAFMTNPTSCAEAPTTFDATSYDGGKASATAAFTPTDCDALPYDPSFSAVVSGETGEAKHPTLVTNVGQVDGEANTRKVQVVLPTDFGVSLSNLGRACVPDAFAADQCPDAATVGAATAVTPLLTTPLAGPVLFVVGSANLPDLVLKLRGPLSMTLRGSNAFAPGGGQETTFDGLPDVPLSKFELAFTGGSSGLLTATHDLCRGTPPQFGATFTSQAGKVVTKTVSATVEGCEPAKPTIRFRLNGRSLRLTVLGNGTRLKRLRVVLPKGVSLSKKARGSVSGGNAKGSKLSLKRKTIALNVPGAGARTLGLAMRTGSVKHVKLLRKRAARISVTPATGKSTVKRLKAK